jgi:chemotaxis methyl-accepting protein methylase
MNLELQALLSLIETNTGLRLNSAQTTDLGLTLEKLARSQQISAGDLVGAFKEGQKPELLAELQTKFTVSETHFYRIAPQIGVLKNNILPELIKRNRSQQKLRFWSAGCSSGEEVYTLLILLEEIGGVQNWDVQVLGTDLNPDVLELARVGIYGHWSFRDTPLPVIERFFEANGGKYQVRADLRTRAIFEIHNLLVPPDTSQKFDLILCRNVTIYFSPTSAQGVYQNLARQLLPGGWFILGPSDPPIQPNVIDQIGLERVILPGVIVWKKPEQSQKISLIQVQIPEKSGLQNQKPEAWQQYLKEGYQSLQAQNYNTALEQLRRAAFLEPKQAIVQIGMAQAFVGLRQHARALGALRQAQNILLNLEPDEKLWGCDKTIQELLQLVTDLFEQAEVSA